MGQDGGDRDGMGSMPFDSRCLNQFKMPNENFANNKLF